MTMMENKESKKAVPGKKKVFILVLALALIVGALIGWYLSGTKTVAVVSLPEQLSYDYGDTLNTQGLSVLVTNNLGKTETITEGFVCEPMELIVAGQQEITVTYDGKSDVFTVEAIPVLTEITVAAMPEDAAYLAGEELDLQGFSLQAHYNDGSARIVEDYVCQPVTISGTAGQQEITVSYEDKTTTFEVEVLEVAEITANGRGANRMYMVGDIPNPEGAVLEVTYTNGMTEKVETGFTCVQEPFAETGEQEVTLCYGGKEATYTAQVYPTVTFENDRYYVTSIYSTMDPEMGRNQAGELVNWTLCADFSVPAEVWRNFDMTVTCSWTDEVSGLGSEGWVYGYQDAKEGKTFVEWGTYDDGSGEGMERILFTLYLPDNPGIAGEQWVEIGFGSSVKRIPLTLEYEGDYETGTGWKPGYLNA